MDYMKPLTLGSLFDGSGGFPLGGLLAGITPVWSCEIEPFPIRVTTKRMPFIKHYGDISTLNGAELEPVDIITFGSPCQDISIAGKRAGIQDGARSSLFFQAIRIIKEMREKTNGEKPRWICWENVPGAFSSNKGRDFKAVLEAVIGVKEPASEVPAPGQKGWPWADYYVGIGWSVAYRVLDAQWWGVPQRRARIFLVADFAGECAQKVLFESEGVSGYSAQGFRAWQRAARNAEESSGTAGADGIGFTLNDQGGKRMDVTTDRTGTLRAEAHHPPVVIHVPFSAGFCTEHSAHSRSIGYEMEMAPTLRAGVVPAAVYENHSQDSRYTGPLSTAPTVNATYGMGGNNQPFVIDQNAPPYTLKIRCGKEGGGKGALIQDDKSATLGCSNDQTLFAPEEQTAFGTSSDKIHAMLLDNPHAGIYELQTARTLDAQCGCPGYHQGGIAAVASYDVRFTSEGSKVERGHIYPTNTSRTLSTDNHDPARNQGRIAVVEKACPIEGNGQRPSHRGDGWNAADAMFTLNATEQHAVAVAFADKHTAPSAPDVPLGPSGQMFANPEENFAGHPPVYTSTVGSYMTAGEEVAQTLMARDYKDPQVVNHPHYIVRRLTPVECARLQGFPDWWCSCLATEDPTEEDISFWHDVWETHRKVIGTAKKPKSRKQLVKWLKSPHSDAAEYKMWGNGVALPCVWFVLAGIVYYNQFMG